jgi:hypothetical protein
MDIFALILTIIGLSVFEIVSSIDNAVVNAEVLATMSEKAKRWFLRWGMLIAVFLVRGLLPWIIVWVATPGLGFVASLTATFSSDPLVRDAIETAAPILLSGGGIFLVFLFFHWLFLEKKNVGLHIEHFFLRQGIWFYAVVSAILAVIVYLSLKINPVMAFGAVIGSTAFFITHGFKQNAEHSEEHLLKNSGGLSDMSKILYLEVIDTTFSIDGVLGAFAFTFSVPLIIVGSGIGAIVLRRLTVSNIDRIKKYIYLKNGAMYSIFCLGAIMLLDAFGAHIPEWLSPVITLGVIAYFYWKSKRTRPA